MPAFDFTAAMRIVCHDMTQRVAELAHIEMRQVAVGFCQAKKRVPHGLQASLTPLRFEGGAEQSTIRGRRYGCQRLVDRTTDPAGIDCLYLLQFYLPRFLDHSLEEKLTTIVHELWHIGPAFDGDIRRHAGRCFVHGHSQEQYDAHSAQLARDWLAKNPPEGIWSWLEHSFDELIAEHGGVKGQKFRAPKLVRLDGARV